MKDRLLNKKSVTFFADLFYVHNPQFPKKEFINNILMDFPGLELKERITRIRQELENFLPKEYPKAIEILLEALPLELDPTMSDDDFGDFILCSISDYVVTHGCHKKYLTLSLLALEEITKRFSAEYAIRFFLNAFPDETYQFLLRAATSHNYHVRRLSSEATRPKLPWGIGITTEYHRALPILDILYSDTTRYVTRSVANHVNDISKIDPELVITTLLRWQSSRQQEVKEMTFIMRHSLRTLIKKAYILALELLGYVSPPELILKNIQIHTPIVQIGNFLEFSFDLTSGQDQNLLINYIIYYQLPSGTTQQRVFSIKKTSAQKNMTLHISKKQVFKYMSTKKLYPGTHHCELQINGIHFPLGSFVLEI